VSTALATSVDEVVNQRAVETLYQPVVHLETGDVLGFEALARGPRGTPFESPEALFEAARTAGRLAELDWVCRASAYRTALDGNLPDGVSLFVNAVPEALSTPCPPDLAPAILAAQLRLRVVTELITRDPAALLVAAPTCRSAGWGVAFDKVGAEPKALALLPFVHPDVLKLDISLVQQPQGAPAARVVNAAAAYAERTGAAILAVGVETTEHLATARSMGATLGQGWLFGRPGPLPSGSHSRRPSGTVPFTGVTPADGSARTPYEIVTANRPTAVCSKRQLAATTGYLETKALDTAEPPVVLASFQRHFTATTARRYADLARTAAFVAAFAAELPDAPIQGVRGCAIAGDDPLRAEWNVVVAGPHFAGALVARDLGDQGPDGARRFAYALTYDRHLVIEAARALLDRL